MICDTHTQVITGYPSIQLWIHHFPDPPHCCQLNFFGFHLRNQTMVSLSLQDRNISIVLHISISPGLKWHSFYHSVLESRYSSFVLQKVIRAWETQSITSGYNFFLELNGHLNGTWEKHRVLNGMFSWNSPSKMVFHGGSLGGFCMFSSIIANFKIFPMSNCKKAKFGPISWHQILFQ